jgi:hypothetical protein
MSEADKKLLALAIIRTRVSYFTADERVRLAELCREVTGWVPKGGKI